MAIGLLAYFKATSVGTTTVYTVPAGISHAVVHMTTFGTNSYLAVNGALILISPGTTEQYNSVSVMLSPGDVVSFTAASINHTCTISGYEVA